MYLIVLICINEIQHIVLYKKMDFSFNKIIKLIQ